MAVRPVFPRVRCAYPGYASVAAPQTADIRFRRNPDDEGGRRAAEGFADMCRQSRHPVPKESG
jgi:hypothetical protein